MTTDDLDAESEPRIPPTQSVTIRFPLRLLDEIRALAEERDVPYQSMVKLWLRERVDEELGQGRFRKRR